jgi:hypothetical protein
MPALLDVAAMINDGVVVNVGALSTENDYTEWLNQAESEYDEVRIVRYAGIGWKVTEDGLRPDKPYESWVWNDEDGWYEAPVPYPSDGGSYVWDEAAQQWATA